MAATIAKGRKKGTTNRGYFFRKGRGWCTSEGTQAIPLTDAEGNKLRERATSGQALRAALARHLEARRIAAAAQAAGHKPTVVEVCNTYLTYCKANSRPETYKMRASVLFDFCTGLPASLREKPAADLKPADLARRIHAGYGSRLYESLSEQDIRDWWAKHPRWNESTKRLGLIAVRRSANHVIRESKGKLIGVNALSQFEAPRSRSRKVYITPELEQVIYDHLGRYGKRLRLAIKVMIRTGARPGEFARMEARHITFAGERMEVRFDPDESKNHRVRVIRCAEPDIVQAAKAAVAKYPTGPIWRCDEKGNVWTPRKITVRFRQLRRWLASKGHEHQETMTAYACRHTFAKRVLYGYWTGGKPSNIETLCELMGNTREVCWRHYAQWCEGYNEPLWTAI